MKNFAYAFCASRVGVIAPQTPRFAPRLARRYPNLGTIWLSSLIAAALLSAAPAFAQEEESPSISGAWTFPSLTENATVAVYMMVANPGDKPLTITGAHSPLADKAELHTHRISDDGVMHMDKLMQVQVAPRSKLEFNTGGLHVMLFGVKKTLKEGDSLPLTLQLGRDGQISTNALVHPRQVNKEKTEAAPAAEKHDHEHQH